jgi:hypothetical protein
MSQRDSPTFFNKLKNDQTGTQLEESIIALIPVRVLCDQRKLSSENDEITRGIGESCVNTRPSPNVFLIIKNGNRKIIR